MIKQKNNFRKSKYTEYVRDLTSLGNPIILGFVSIISIGLNIELLYIAIGLIINDIIGMTIKYFFPKTRPNKQSYTTALEKIDAGSFPSIHSSRTSFIFLTLGYLSGDIYTFIVFTLLVLITGYSRIFLKKHFLIDVMAGYVLGISLFVSFVYLYQNILT